MPTNGSTRAAEMSPIAAGRAAVRRGDRLARRGDALEPQWSPPSGASLRASSRAPGDSPLQRQVADRDRLAADERAQREGNKEKRRRESMAVHADLHAVDEFEGDLDEQEEAARAYLLDEEEEDGEDDVEDDEEEAELPPRGISPEPDAKNDAPPPTKTGRPAPDDGKRTNVRARAHAAHAHMSLLPREEPMRARVMQVREVIIDVVDAPLDNVTQLGRRPACLPREVRIVVGVPQAPQEDKESFFTCCRHEDLRLAIPASTNLEA